MRVMKFGGTSLGNPGSLTTAVTVVREARLREPVVVVASALAGVTDLLNRVSTGKAAPEPRWLEERHLELWRAVTSRLLEVETERKTEALRLEELRFCDGLQKLGGQVEDLCREEGGGEDWDPASRDRLLGFGEAHSTWLLASLLRVGGRPARAVEGREVICTDSTFGGARVRLPETEALLQKMVEDCPPEAVPVLGGFAGADALGRPTTLGRGSSDLTAALVGRALSARVVEIWTDVDGIHRHDPRLEPGAPLLTRLDYGQARELARKGAKVLHPETLDPLEPAGIPLLVRNTFDPHAPGTLVGPRIHAAVPQERVIRLVLAGASGGVGRALLEQIQELGPGLREEGWSLEIVGAVNSRSQLWDPAGIQPSRLETLLGRGEAPDLPELARRMSQAGNGTAPGSGGGSTVFVDCTASPGVADLYLPLLEGGTSVVTANKLAGSGEGSAYRRLLEAARRSGASFRYETTVGAALPVLKTVRELRRVGHVFREVSGALSGTLSYVFAALAGGMPFSEAVAEARELGLTEPHPAEDLTGMDVVRKMVIILREAGVEVEVGDVAVESLVPEGLKEEGDPEAFLAALRNHDSAWEERHQRARKEGEVLAYVAEFDGERARVGVRRVPKESPLAALRSTENLVLLRTDLYAQVPLSIAGPGAGRALTASGVLADILADQSRGWEDCGRWRVPPRC